MKACIKLATLLAVAFVAIVIHACVHDVPLLTDLQNWGHLAGFAAFGIVTGPANFFAFGDQIDYTNPSAVNTVNAGQVVVQNDTPMVNPADIAPLRKGALAARGIFQTTKDASTFFAFQRVYWDLVALVATSDPTKGPFMGKALFAQLTGDATVYVILDSQTTADTYYVLPAASAALTNTVVETTLGSANFPANRLQVGDVIHFFCQGIVTAVNGADTFQIKGYMGGVNLFASAVQNPTINDIFQFDGDIVVRALGNAGAGLIVSSGTQGWGTAGAATSKPWYIGATNLDTTIAELFKITGKWNNASPGDSARLDMLDMQLLRQQ